MCHILGLTPSPHNGTWSLVKAMLRTRGKHLTKMVHSDSNSFSPLPLMTVVTCVFVFLIVMWIFINKPCKKPTNTKYRRLEENSVQYKNQWCRSTSASFLASVIQNCDQLSIGAVQLLLIVMYDYHIYWDDVLVWRLCCVLNLQTIQYV